MKTIADHPKSLDPYSETFLREEYKLHNSGKRQIGRIFLCKECKNEIFIRLYAIHKSTFTCKKCCMGKRKKLPYNLHEGNKKCTTCLNYHPIDQFTLNKTYRRSNCNECSKLKKFNIGKVEYDTILNKQNGCCAICGEREDIVNKFNHKKISLSIDHDHVSGAIRGLLCGKCNKALGLFKDDIDLMLKAIGYLRKFK